jgi:hypothetical protein
MSKSAKNQESQITKANTALAQEQDMGAWGTPAVSSKDIVIPKILCMQGLSELVMDDNHDAKMGDFVDSMTNEIIGNYLNKPVRFVPFHLEKIWIISRKNGNDFEFDRIEDVTLANEHRQYFEVLDGVEYKNEYTMNFYVLRPEDTSLPYVISFKGMSGKAGRVLATQMYVKNAAAGKIPPAYVMELTGSKDNNNKGTFITLKTSVLEESTEQQRNEAFTWYKSVTSGGAKAHQEAKPTEQAEATY